MKVSQGGSAVPLRPDTDVMLAPAPGRRKVLMFNTNGTAKGARTTGSTARRKYDGVKLEAGWMHRLRLRTPDRVPTPISPAPVIDKGMTYDPGGTLSGTPYSLLVTNWGVNGRENRHDFLGYIMQCELSRDTGHGNKKEGHLLLTKSCRSQGAATRSTANCKEATIPEVICSIPT